MKLNTSVSDKQFNIIQLLIIVAFSCLPLLTSFPFRVNIYLTWEGAFRIANGEIPYRDFGSPIGFGFWLIPALFFKVFGPYMLSLLLAQTFINAISFLCLRNIFKLFKVSMANITLVLLLFGLSFTLINFWPWYNHTVFFFELVGLLFVVKYLFQSPKKYFLFLAALFTGLAFFTKQDGGGLMLMLILALLVYVSIAEKQIKGIAWYLGFTVLVFVIFIVPLSQYDFSYWFNYGQEPHYSRISMYNFLMDIFQGSLWIKFYMIVIIIFMIRKAESIKDFFKNVEDGVFGLLILGIMVQAMIIQVTSFSPPTVNYYYHTFGIAFILHILFAEVKLQKVSYFALAVACLLFWRSENYWKYSMKVVGKFLPKSFSAPPPDVVSKGNWASKKDTVKVEPVQWVTTNIKSLKRIKLPKNTLEGINKIKALPVASKDDLMVLNMSNLTFLRHELGYTSPRSPYQPLWFHYNVAFFERETKLLCEQLDRGIYDIILFEDMPDVDNFFPYEVRDCALSNYKFSHKFRSPTGYPTDHVEVYIKK